MPNTLAHFGIQALASKAVDRRADIKWVAVGCILPDLSWITQRLIPFLVPGIDLLSLRVYCLIQASLFFCLLLSGSIAILLAGALVLIVSLLTKSSGKKKNKKSLGDTSSFGDVSEIVSQYPLESGLMAMAAGFVAGSSPDSQKMLTELFITLNQNTSD